MKLNHDCVRDVLLFVEEEQRPGIFLHLNDFISIQDKDTSTKKRLSMYDAETIKYTLMVFQIPYICASLLLLV